MPVVTRADCTQTNVQESYKFTKTDSGYIPTIEKVKLQYQACQGAGDQDNDLSAFVVGLASGSSTSDNENVNEDDNTCLEQQIRDAIGNITNEIDFDPNQSQIDAIAWAFQRQVSFIRGPPGTGKTRVAALPVKTALELKSSSVDATNVPSDDKINSDDEKSK